MKCPLLLQSSITFPTQLHLFCLLVVVLCILHVFQYVHTLGMGKTYEFCDVFGLDSELLMMVPQPVISVVVLYPLTDKV